jgi:mono/diheme cytochrome c family protein
LDARVYLIGEGVPLGKRCAAPYPSTRHYSAARPACYFTGNQAQEASSLFQFDGKVVKLAGVTIVLVALLLAAIVVFAQVPGRQDYLKNCAGCHGADGKGNGPDLYVVPGIEPPDLTTLAKRNGGVFPFQATEDAIDGRKGIASHQRFDMPFWGVTMQEQGKEFTPQSEARVKARLDALVHYIESIQRH